MLELGQELGGIAGTTITGVVLPTRVEDSVHEQAIDEYCYVINVGDSRTYICAPMRKAIGWRSR